MEESQLAEIYTVRDLVDAVLESAAARERSRDPRRSLPGGKPMLEEDQPIRKCWRWRNQCPSRKSSGLACSRVVQIFALDRFI